MSELVHNKWLTPILTVAVLVGTIINALLQKSAYANFSVLIIAIFISLLVQITIISAIWGVTLKWPKAGGAIMLFLFGVIVFSAIPAYFDGRMSGANDNPALLGLFITLAVLYAVAGVMLFLSKKVVKDEATT